MMIVALVGSMLVFSGAINFLNSTYLTMFYGMVTPTATGGAVGTTVEVLGGVATVVVGVMGKLIMALVLLVLYVVMVYAMAMTIFKMVDKIPNGIIDYFGIGSVEPITDTDGAAKSFNAGLVAIVGQNMVTSAVVGPVKSKKAKQLSDYNDMVKEQNLRQQIEAEYLARNMNSGNNHNIPQNNFGINRNTTPPAAPPPPPPPPPLPNQAQLPPPAV